ncbi:uncharacterized protein LOC110038187 [Phalaenopsis equestris]|uniref:uncharacterized protein LOC110038187 n=1 Tax=Phalaenopsis equestris TaxID=78828 RepID=UPI0009E58BB1|nr:uncharacterized protein LOC110038187 [Phalaenopsis equestris]
MEKRVVVCRHGVGQNWRLLKENTDDIFDITLIGNDHVYILDKYLNLYVLDERCSSMRLVRFRLWVQKQILQVDGVNDPIDKQLSSNDLYMKTSGKSDLKIYVYCRRNFFGPHWISLKFDAEEHCSYNADVDVVDVECEAKWVYFYPFSDDRTEYFTPKLRPTIT